MGRSRNRSHAHRKALKARRQQRLAHSGGRAAQTSRIPTAGPSQVDPTPAPKPKARSQGYRQRQAKRSAKRKARKAATQSLGAEAGDDAEMMDEDLSDVDWEEWEKAGFFIPDSYKLATAHRTHAPCSELQIGSQMESSIGMNDTDKPRVSTPTRELSEQEIIDQAFELAVEFLSNHPQASTFPKARREKRAPRKSRETWLSAAAKVFGIHELYEQVLWHLRQDEILRARGINKKVRATVHTSKLLRKGLFFEPASDEIQSFWVQSQATEAIAHIRRDALALHATVPDHDERLLLPRALNPYLIGRAPLPGTYCRRGHLRCEYAEMAQSVPRANQDFERYLQGELIYHNGPLVSLTAPGYNVGFTSIRFPRFDSNQPSMLDDMLLTQPPSYSVVVSCLTQPTCGATHAIYVDCRVDNPSGVRVSDVRTAVSANDHGTEELSGDVGLMVLDRDGRVVLPTYHWKMAKRYMGIVCTEELETWDMWDMKAVLMGWK